MVDLGPVKREPENRTVLDAQEKLRESMQREQEFLSDPQNLAEAHEILKRNYDRNAPDRVPLQNRHIHVEGQSKGVKVALDVLKRDFGRK